MRRISLKSYGLERKRVKMKQDWGNVDFFFFKLSDGYVKIYYSSLVVYLKKCHNKKCIYHSVE